MAADFEPSQVRTSTISKWEKLKYGMFVHFGLGTMTFDEYGYKNTPASAFDPQKLDVDQWVRVAKNAGMKYMVLTTKHCTGHALWPTKLSEHSVLNSACKTDVVGEFVKACRKYKVEPAFYYLLGWDAYHQPKMDVRQYEEFCKGQITELLTNYGQITQLWLDIPWDFGEDTLGALQRIYNTAKSLQPDCLVLPNQGFRDGSKVEGYYPSYKRDKVPTIKERVPMWPRDVNNGERTMPPVSGHNPNITFQGKQYYLPNEVCDTILHDWFWRADDPMRSLWFLHTQYQRATGRNSNFLLNVGPDRDGKIRAEAVSQLMALRKAINNPSAVLRNLSIGAKASASSTSSNRRYHADNLVTDPEKKGGTYWGADEKDKNPWYQVEFPEETTFDRLFICEFTKNVTEFKLERRNPDGTWQPFYKGTSLPLDGRPLRFKPVKSKALRFVVTHCSEPVVICDFEVGNSKISVMD